MQHLLVSADERQMNEARGNGQRAARRCRCGWLRRLHTRGSGGGSANLEGPPATVTVMEIERWTRNFTLTQIRAVVLQYRHGARARAFALETAANCGRNFLLTLHAQSITPPAAFAEGSADALDQSCVPVRLANIWRTANLVAGKRATCSLSNAAAGHRAGRKIR